MKVNVTDQDGTTTTLAADDPRAPLAAATIANLKTMLVNVYLRNLFIVLTIVSGLLGMATHVNGFIVAVVVFGALATNASMNYRRAFRRVPVLAAQWQAASKKA